MDSSPLHAAISCQDGVVVARKSKAGKPVPNGDMQRVFGENLKVARTAADLTQAQVAELSGIRQQHISRAESGRLNVTINTMSALAKVVGRPLSALLTPSLRRRKK